LLFIKKYVTIFFNMSLSIGIIGLPNVGKSTLFNALTKRNVETANYPFCTIDPAVGVVGVPDERLIKLAEMSASESVIPAVVEFFDIAGLVKGASEGAGLGNKFLSHIREVDAIAHMVRIFEDDKITHVHDGAIDPLRDIEIINTELSLADMDTMQKRIDGISRALKQGNKDTVVLAELFERAMLALNDGVMLSELALSLHERALMNDLHLLTLKPIIYVFNKKSQGANIDNHDDMRYEKLLEYIKSQNAEFVVLDAEVESELCQMNEEEKAFFITELNHKYSGIDNLIKSGYKLLDLITFFTTGPKESRGWTVKRGSSIKEAGSAIHTDFRDKFIRADVVLWSDLLQARSYAQAREVGLVRTEGKDYIVQDGDVVIYKI
jgi:ribosome-binding ATPase